MSSTLSIATPALPTSPRARGESESRPICVGRSNATERPVCPASSRSLNRSLVFLALPKPAYWRIVHSRPRYIVGCTPRVNGYSPGKPRSLTKSKSCKSSGSYARLISIPELVANFALRSGPRFSDGLSLRSSQFLRASAILRSSSGIVLLDNNHQLALFDRLPRNNLHFHDLA